MTLRRGFQCPIFSGGGQSEYDRALFAAALGIINATRQHHGMDPINWEFPALSSEHKRGAQRQAAGAIAALVAAGFDISPTNR